MWVGNPEVSRNDGEFCYVFHHDSALILHVRAFNISSSNKSQRDALFMNFVW